MFSMAITTANNAFLPISVQAAEEGEVLQFDWMEERIPANISKAIGALNAVCRLWYFNTQECEAKIDALELPEEEKKEVLPLVRKICGKLGQLILSAEDFDCKQERIQVIKTQIEDFTRKVAPSGLFDILIAIFTDPNIVNYEKCGSIPLIAKTLYNETIPKLKTLLTRTDRNRLGELEAIISVIQGFHGELEAIISVVPGFCGELEDKVGFFMLYSLEPLRAAHGGLYNRYHPIKYVPSSKQAGNLNELTDPA
jgi:hypothetical protein